jgi:uncharacterized protein (DUF433 family)
MLLIQRSPLAIIGYNFGSRGEKMDSLLQRITVNPNMAFGKPTIRGTRYSVEWLLELLSSGMSQDEILADYEDLEADDIYAVLAYAAKLVQVKRTITVAV